MGLFRSSKREAESPTSDRARAASLNRFGFRRHRAEKGDDGGGGGGLTFSRRRSPKSCVEERRPSGGSTEEGSSLNHKVNDGTLTARSESPKVRLQGTGDANPSETRPAPEQEAKVEGAAEEPPVGLVRKSRPTTKPCVRMASQTADRNSNRTAEENQQFVEKRWRTKSSPVAVSVHDTASFNHSKAPDGTQLTPRGGGSIIKVSNEVVTVRPSAVKQAEQKKPGPNRRVSINAAEKKGEMSSCELDSPRYVPKKAGVVKTAVMQKVSNLDSFENSTRKYPHSARAAIQVEPDPTPKVVRKLRQWPPPPRSAGPSSQLQDLDDDDFDAAASPAASETSTVASPVAKDMETRKVLSQSAAKLGFHRRATMLVGEKEYTNVKTGQPASTPPSRAEKSADTAGNANTRMSPLAACPGFGNEGTANELLKALAFRREKTLKLEQSWGGQGVLDDLSSAPDSDSEAESDEKLNLTEVS